MNQNGVMGDLLSDMVICFFLLNIKHFLLKMIGDGKSHKR